MFSEEQWADRRRKLEESIKEIDTLLNPCAKCGGAGNGYKYCLTYLARWYDPEDLNGPDRQMILEQKPGLTSTDT